MIVEKDNITTAVREILKQYPNQRIFVMDGEMGVGKTTFSTEFAKALGSLDHPSSPTFAIANVYLRDNGEEMYHFDFYRLEHFEEAIDIGVEEYFESGNYCFIEWPDIIERLLPDSYIRIKIKHTDQPDYRELEIVEN
jgi:tRNA threonylcarbamoyladenosine biosynthesis protein TsaE